MIIGTIVDALVNLHTYDTIDNVLIRAATTVLGAASIGRWVISEGKVTIKRKREAKEELLRDKERIAKHHAKHPHSTSHTA